MSPEINNLKIWVDEPSPPYNMDEPKRQAQKRLADLIMRTGKVGHA